MDNIIGSEVELFHLEAEQVVLGALLLDNEYINKIDNFLQAKHFYEPAHQKIYEHLVYMIDTKNIVANDITLKHFFETDEKVRNLGGLSYLSTLLMAARTVVDIADYAKIIYDLALKRELVNIARKTVSNIYSQDIQHSGLQYLDDIEGELFNLEYTGDSKGGEFVPFASALKETLQKIDTARKQDSNISGISTGLIDLDAKLGGLQKSDLIIIAARPSMGKSSLALTLAVNACQYLEKNLNQNLASESDRASVAFFSLEMPSEQLSSRTLSMQTGIESSKFRIGALDDQEWESLVQNAEIIHKMPLYIDDSAALSITAMKNRVRRLMKKSHVSLVVVDYLQLMTGTSIKAQTNRVLEISEITQGLKAIAKEFNIPVIALSQLSRAAEARENKRPLLSDLRESGTIEQDADVVMFIYREAYYIERECPNVDIESEKYMAWKHKMEQFANKAEIIIAKQRNGPIGTVTASFNPSTTKFGNDGSQYDLQNYGYTS